jgi:cytochrome c peroxidase
VLCAGFACGAANAAEYQWHLPPGFPTPFVPRDNPMSEAKVALGRRLFFETRLSVSGRYACSSCHEPALAFTDARARAVGATGATLRRASLSLANVAYAPAYTWNDPRITTLEQQMLTPLLAEHPLEMGLHGRVRAVEAMLATDLAYQSAFRRAFPGELHPIRLRRIVEAIASFERTLISGRSAFDRYVFDDDRDALSPLAKQGMRLFYSARVGCSSCHGGLAFAGPVRTRLAAPRPSYADDELAPDRHADAGLMEATHRPADRGRFKVPTLRNVAVTGPYLHDGSMATLAQVLEAYGRVIARRQGAVAASPGLSAAESDALAAFLMSLTDRDFLTNPAYRDPPAEADSVHSAPPAQIAAR